MGLQHAGVLFHGNIKNLLKMETQMKPGKENIHGAGKLYAKKNSPCSKQKLVK
jgi:hypothetical protein